MTGRTRRANAARESVARRRECDRGLALNWTSNVALNAVTRGMLALQSPRLAFEDRERIEAALNGLFDAVTA